jgi:transposase
MRRQVRRLGPNSAGEELSPGAVQDCYLGLLVDQPLAATLPAPGSLVVVGPAALLDARVRQADGQAVYDLVTGHPDRTPRDLVFLADLAVDLRAWQDADWRTQGIDVDGVSEAIVQLARRGQVRARWYHELTAWDAKALGRPAMDYARAELRNRLDGWLAELYMRWLHPTSGPRPDDEPFL